MRSIVVPCLCMAAVLILPCVGGAAGGGEYRAPASGAHLAPPLPEQTTRRLTLPPAVQEPPAATQDTPQAADGPTPAGSAQAASLPSAPSSVARGGAALGAPALQSRPGPQGGAVPYSQAVEQLRARTRNTNAAPEAAPATGGNAGLLPPALPPAGERPSAAAPGRAQSAPSPGLYAGVPEEGDILYGTSRLEGSHFESRGHVRHMRDPRTGDIVTSVLPPPPPAARDYGTVIVAPQLYPGWFGGVPGYWPHNGGLPVFGGHGRHPGARHDPPRPHRHASRDTERAAHDRRRGW